MLGIVTGGVVRILRRPRGDPHVLRDVPRHDEAGEAFRAIVAAGIVPAAIEMMDTLAIEAHRQGGDRARLAARVGAAFLMDVDGHGGGGRPHGRASDDIARAAGALE